MQNMIPKETIESRAGNTRLTEPTPLRPEKSLFGAFLARVKPLAQVRVLDSGFRV